MASTTSRTLIFLLAVPALACTNDRDTTPFGSGGFPPPGGGATSDGAPPTGDSAGSSGITSGGTGGGPGGTSDGSGSPDSGGPIFDVGAGSATGAGDSGGPKACRKVDLLISVDNSSSMQQEISALQGPVFNSFPAQLLAAGNGLEDFHLGFIDGCNNPPYLHNWGESGACNFSTGANYLVSSSPSFDQEYACVSDLPGSGANIFPPPAGSHGGYDGMPDGCSGSSDDEQPANTSSLVVTEPALSGPNAGFLRDDAVLFIVAITDEDEQPIPNASAQEIADRIIAAKGTIENVVFVGIGGVGDIPDDGELECSGPYGSAKDAVFLREVTSIFEQAGRGLFWDLCSGDLEQGFAAAIELVDVACDEFVPPG